MEEEQSSAEVLSDKIKEYIKTRLAILQLSMVRNIAAFTSKLSTYLALFFLLGMFLLLLSIGFSLYLGELTGCIWNGFYITAGIYLSVFILAYLFRKTLLKNPIQDMLIENMLEENNDETNDPK
jgi:hypothetical protein